jgi:hypothetical protein
LSRTPGVPEGIFYGFRAVNRPLTWAPVVIPLAVHGRQLPLTHDNNIGNNPKNLTKNLKKFFG